MSVVPESVLNLLTWSDLETGVCGDPVVSVTQLKAACKYDICFCICNVYLRVIFPSLIPFGHSRYFY